MAESPSVRELVKRWNDLRRQGRSVSPEELCADCPERLAELKQQLAAAAAMEDFLSMAPGHPLRPAGAPGAEDEAATLPPPPAADASLHPAPTVPPAPISPADSDATCYTTLPPEPPAAAPGNGPAVPGYDLLGVLGRGGMGVVYKARQLRLNRLVALKMILAGAHAGERELARFRTEAEAVARLQHPHIVQIYEVGEADGTPYCALEYCDGGSLDKKLRGTPQPSREAARLVETLAGAVHAAHQAGIVHRDLKPANVLLTADGQPKITDFGLAKKLDSATGQTASGAIMGTPSYMAPEQAGGQSKEVGPAADIYALGAILYELLTGRPPFKAATSMDTLLQVVSAEPVPVRQLQPKLPRDLETICLKCLQKESPKRYASAVALAEDLRRFQAGEPIAARPVGRLERAWRWCKRNPAMAGGLSLGALSLLLGSILALTFAFRAEAARRSEAERAESEARAKESEAKRAESEAQAKNEADQARRDAQRQSVDLCVASGLTAAREGDHSLALLWFARAVQLAKDEPQQEELNRIRMANWLRQVCLPEGTFAVPRFRHNHDRFRQFQFSPDGNFLLVVASTGDCLVWDRRRGQLVPLPEPAAKGSAAAWQPGSNLLAVAEKSGLIRFLATPDFRPVDEVRASGSIAVLAFSRDGKRLAWGSGDGARVWDRDRKEYITPLLPHGGQVVALAFSSGADRLATASRDKKARVFRLPSEAAEPLFPPVPHVADYATYSHTGPDVSCPRFAAADQVLLTVEAVQGDTLGLKWRSAATGRELARKTEGDIFAVSEQQARVAVLGETKGRLLNAYTGQVLSPIPAAPPWRWNEHVIFSADEQTLVTCGHDTRARFFSVQDRSGDTLIESHPAVYHPMSAVRVSLSADSRYLATALWDGSVYLWRLPSGPPIAYMALAGGTSVPALTPDKKFVIPRGITYRNGNQLETRVYDAQTGKPAGPTLAPGGIVLDAAFSPDGTQVATSSSAGHTPFERNQLLFAPDGKGGCVQIWDWKTGKRLVGPIPTPGEPRGLAFRPDGSMLAVVCADYRVLLIDPKTGTIRRCLDPGLRTRPQNANQWRSNGEARFSPDGRFLVTWEMTPHVHVWDPDRGELLHTLQHTDRVGYAAFHPTAAHLLATTAGWGSEPRVWNLNTGKLVVRLEHPQAVGELDFSPDGRKLLTIAGDGVLRSWDWQAGKLLDGWPFHASGFHDFHFTSDRRWLVTINAEELEVIDWPTKAPVSPRWKVPPYSTVGLEIPAGDRRAIVGGFTPALVGYDLETMRTPIAAPVEDLVALAELAAGRRILSQGNVVPLNSSDWLERWRLLQRKNSSRLLESLQPTAHELRQREVQRLVDSLFERLIRKSAVLRHLHQDTALDEELREEALARAQIHVQDAEHLNSLSWMVVRTANNSPQSYARALLQAEEACSLTLENGLALNTLGVAQYRVGNYQQAIRTLMRSERLNRDAAGQSAPADLAFLSMAQHRLGLKEQALATLERLRQRMSAPDQAKAPATAAEEATRNENHEFFKEAKETILGKDGSSQQEKPGAGATHPGAQTVPNGSGVSPSARIPAHSAT
jgi:WD40 repeat protein